MMDLFSDFSFGNPSSRRINQYDDLDMEDVSPSSSRSASPSASSLPSPPAYPRRVSMAELADQFDAQTLSRGSHNPSPLFGRLQNPSATRRSTLSPISDSFDTVRRRRASGARNLCSSVRLASIETLVDRMLKDGSSCYASHHPSSGRAQGRRSEITSAPTSMPLTPGGGSETTSSDEDSEIEGPNEPRSTKAKIGAAAAKKRSGIEKSRKKATTGRR